MNIKLKNNLLRFIREWMYDNSTDTMEFVEHKMWTDPFNASSPRKLSIDLYLDDSAQCDTARSSRLDNELTGQLRAQFDTLEETEIVIQFAVRETAG